MKKILVVVDMQNDFIDGPLGTPEARVIVDNVCKKIREGEWDKICYTMDTHDDRYLETQEGKRLPIPHCIIETYGWEINNDVYKAIHETVGDDERKWDGWKKGKFVSDELITWSVPNPFNQSEYECTIVGVCTDICVVSNALAMKAHYPEMKIVVDASCCAGSTYAKHLMALEVMKSCQIDIENEPFAWLKLVD